MTPLLGVLLAGVAEASGAYLVRDLRTEPNYSFYLSADLATVDERALLTTALPGFGVEPWVSDGTPEGTTLLRNLAPGGLSSEPHALARLGPLLLFRAWSPGESWGLWVTDGSPEGTRALLARSATVPLGVLEGVFYFGGSDAIHGLELWRTDGSEDGTWLVSDLRPGPESGVCGTGGAVAGERLFFCGFDGAGRVSPWISDGSRAGSRRLGGQVAPATYPPSSFFGVGGLVYFRWWDWPHGWELWSSDGTAKGTGIVTDLVPGPADSRAVPAAAAGERLVFVAYPPGSYSARPWSTDGTEHGTVRLAEVEVDWPDSGAGELFFEVNGRVFFTGWTSQLGREPWTTDATPQGTYPLGDLAPGGSSSAHSRGAGRGHDGVYFCSHDGSGESWIWRTDGKPPGTVRIAPTENCEEIRDSVAVDGRTLLDLCWWYSCGPHDDCDQCRLWRTDGTLDGTEPFWPDPIEISSSAPFALAASPSGLVFGATPDQPSNDDDDWLLRSDGTETGTFPLTTPGGEPVQFGGDIARLPTGLLLLSTWSPSTGSELCRTDGDTLFRVFELPDAGVSSPRDLTTIGDWVYLAGYGAQAGDEVWRSDGTADGTTMVLDIAPGDSESSDPRGFAGALGRAWFGARNRFVGTELWESGGTPQTTIAHDLVRGGPPASSWPEQIRELDPVRGSLIFRSGNDLYSYLPASRTATFLKTTRSGVYRPDLAFVVVDSTLYFVDEAEDGGCELWRSDGSVRGTVLVTPIGRGPQTHWPRALCPDEIVVFAGRIYFTACDDEAGCELWTSDGSAAGTGRFADLAPGLESFLPRSLTAIGNRIFFSGCTEDLGCEPWVTDGTLEGTVLLADVAPGPPASDPTDFTLSNSLLFFAADDGTGTELWAILSATLYGVGSEHDASSSGATGPREGAPGSAGSPRGAVCSRR